MFERVCLVHYHEIGLKGRNRADFERRLRDNLEAALVALPVGRIEKVVSRVAVRVHEPERIVDVGRREGWTIVSMLNDWSDVFPTRLVVE